MILNPDKQVAQFNLLQIEHSGIAVEQIKHFLFVGSEMSAYILESIGQFYKHSKLSCFK